MTAITLTPDAYQLYDLLVSGQKPKEVNSLVTCIRNALESTEKPPKQLKESTFRQLNLQEVTSLFFDVLAHLNEDCFDRKLIGHDTKLEQLLATEWLNKTNSKGPDLHTLRNEYAFICKSPTSSKNELGNKLVALIEKEALFALSLGVRPISAGETSTAFFLRSLEGKKIAIYKPDDMSTAGKNNPKVLAKITRWLYKKVLNLKGVRQTRQSIGELFSYKVSGSMGHYMVPPTVILDIKTCELLRDTKIDPSVFKRGSMQVYIDHLITAEKKFHETRPSTIGFLFKTVYKILQDLFLPYRSFFSSKASTVARKALPIAKEVFLTFAIFDFVTGQIDRHFQNWMVRIDGEQEKGDSFIDISVTRLFSTTESGECIVAIDNGASAPIGYINELEGLNQYSWRRFQVADIAISDTMKKIPLANGWQKNVLEDFFTTSFTEDFRGVKEITPEQRVKIEQALIQFIASQAKPVAAQIIANELHSIFSKGVKKMIPPPKLTTRLIKTVNQALAMKERIAVIDCFINPPAGYSHLFTLERLSSIHTQQDYKRFWSSYEKLYNSII